MPSQRRVRAPSRLQRVIHTLRTEGGSRGQEAWAIGLGLAVGFSPFIGLHLGMCIALGWLFGLNRLKLYLAANLVNPLIMPGVLFAEVQLGSWLRRGDAYALSRDTFSLMDPGTSGSTGARRHGPGIRRPHRRRRDLRRAGSALPRSELHASHRGRRGSLSRHVPDRLGIRARQAARRSRVSRGAGIRLAAGVGRAGGCRVRARAAARLACPGDRRQPGGPLAAGRQWPAAPADCASTASSRACRRSRPLRAGRCRRTSRPPTRARRGCWRP